MFSWFLIKEQSMEPSCREGDFVLVNKMSYLFSCPRVGQLVVLEDPRDFSRYILKRITAVKDSFVWVEGDNKEKSTDSRNFGWVGMKALLGQAKVIHKTSLLGRSIMKQRSTS
jgi:signal peptidase I